MALGKTHDFINLLLMPIPLYFTPKEFYLPFVLGYLIGTFFLSPDLDLRHSRPSKRWKKLKFLWLPYHKKAKHRGVSHIPVVGTFVRLLYLNILIILLYFIAIGVLSYLAPELSKRLASVNLLEVYESLIESQGVFYFVLGLIVSELFHIALDFFTSFIKRL